MILFSDLISIIFPWIIFHIQYMKEIMFVSLHFYCILCKSCDRHVMVTTTIRDDVMKWGTLEDSTSGLNNVVYNKCGWLQSVCYYIKASFSRSNMVMCGQIWSNCQVKIVKISKFFRFYDFLLPHLWSNDNLYSTKIINNIN